MNKLFLVSSSLAISIMLGSTAFAATTTSNIANKQSSKVDLPCIQKAVEKRETSIISAADKLAISIKADLTERKNALISAWGITNQADRRVATKTAWNTFKSKQKTDRETHSTATKAAWATWKTDAANCKINIAGAEPQGLDISVSAAAANSAASVTQ